MVTTESDPIPSAGLAQRGLSAIKWSYLGVAGRVTAQLVAQIALARLLGPDTMGVFAAAVLVIGVSSVLAEMGLGAALVHRPSLSDADIRHAFSAVVAAGAVAAMAVYISAGLLAGFFQDARILPVLQAMAPAFVVQAFVVVPQALLQRDLEFRTLQMGQLASYIVSYVVIGAGLAWLGAGVWSLVAAYYSQTLVVFVIFYSQRRHPLKPLLRGDGKGLRAFGAKIVFTNVANWVIENVDKMFVGKLLGAPALGLYAVSYNLVRAPTDHLVVGLQTVLFPTSARAQDNQAGLQRAYLTVVSGVALVAFPVFFAIAAVAGTLVDALFGAKWVGAAPILIPLALAMTGHAVMAVGGPILSGKGSPGAELKVQFFVAIVLVVVLLAASRFSVEVIAWAVFAVFVLRALWMTGTVMRQINLPAARLARALAGGTMIALVVVATLLLADIVLARAGLGAPLRLALEIPLAALVALGSLLGFTRQVLSPELAWVVRQLATRLPPSGRALVMRGLDGGGNRPERK